MVRCCPCHPVQQGGIRLHLVRQTDRQREPGFLTWPWSGQEGWTLSSSLCCPGSWFCGLLPGDEISRASACRWFQEVGARACLSRRSCPWSPAAIPPSLASEALSNATRASRYRSGGTRGSSAPPCLLGPGFTPTQLNISNEVLGDGGGVCLRGKAKPCLPPPSSKLNYIRAF